MILAIEGPDCSGKTTLFNSLNLNAIKIPSIPLVPGEMQIYASVEKKLLSLWEAMYSPKKVFLCDRSMFVTSTVYSLLRGREVLDFSKWYKEVAIVYLDVPEEILISRHDTRGEKDILKHEYRVLRKLYEDILTRPWLDILRLDGTKSDLKETTELWVRHLLEKKCFSTRIVCRNGNAGSFRYQ
jgi:thymidylate kinase